MPGITYFRHEFRPKLTFFIDVIAPGRAGPASVVVWSLPAMFGEAIGRRVRRRTMFGEGGHLQPKTPMMDAVAVSILRSCPLLPLLRHRPPPLPANSTRTLILR